MSALSSTSAGNLLNSLTAARPTVNGLASGLKTDEIIEGLLSVQQSRIKALQGKQSKINTQQTAFKGIEARLLALQTKVGQLARAQHGVFDLHTVASSDEDLVTAAASASAVPGQYTLKVNTLAKAHQIVSQGFASSSSTITQGTFQLSTGSGSAATLTIDSSNNTLQGLANAINAAGTGVSATVLNDGGTQGYRLLLTASKTGSEGAISLTNSLGADGSGAVKPLFDQVVQAATDASVTIGSGAGALTVQSSTNEIDDFLGGVTLSLHGEDAGKSVTLTVANDTSKAGSTIHDFVDSFNDLMKFIDDQVRFDSTTNTAGALQGNRQATTIQDQVRSAMGGTVTGLDSKMNRLSALGITTNNQGQLTINEAKLEDALNGRIAGVTLEDVRNLFALSGSSTNPGVEFVTGSAKTHASNIPYQVSISQAAEQAKVTAGNALAVSTVITSANNTFNLLVDGQASGTITLAEGTYSQQALAQEVATRINADAGLLGRKVTATVNGGMLSISSNAYGGTSAINIGAGTALASLGFAGAESDQGQDVSGNYLVNGLVETATGNGQFLVGTSNNANTADLQVAITLATGQFTPGVVADLTVSRGLASVLDSALGNLLEPVTGRLRTINDGFQTNLEDLAEQVTYQNDLMTTRRDDLLRQFAAMETTVSQLQGISNFLTAQFTNSKKS